MGVTCPAGFINARSCRMTRGHTQPHPATPSHTRSRPAATANPTAGRIFANPTVCPVANTANALQCGPVGALAANAKVHGMPDNDAIANLDQYIADLKQKLAFAQDVRLKLIADPSLVGVINSVGSPGT